MTKKELVKNYKLACYNDSILNTEESKQVRFEALAELGRYAKGQIAKSKKQQLNLFDK